MIEHRKKGRHPRKDNREFKMGEKFREFSGWKGYRYVLSEKRLKDIVDNRHEQSRESQRRDTHTYKINTYINVDKKVYLVLESLHPW